MAAFALVAAALVVTLVDLAAEAFAFPLAEALDTEAAAVDMIEVGGRREWLVRWVTGEGG